MKSSTISSIIIFVISILLAGGLAWGLWGYGKQNQSIYSPMPLNHLHNGAKSCSDCHEGWEGISDEKCIKCHPIVELTDASKSSIASIHEKAFITKQNCVACHTDHRGENGKLTKGFDHSSLGSGANCLNCHQTEAPQKDFHANLAQNCSNCHTTDTWKNAKFDHDLSEFPLTGKHMQVSCKDCHKTEHFTKLDKSCLSCHQQDDKHQGGMGSNCALCHNTTSWQNAVFTHDKFPISGAHNGITCKECHPNQLNYRDFTCTSCHAHDQDRMDRVHSRRGSYVYSSFACYQCHPNGTRHGGSGGFGREGDD